jgi:hypothetical protein
MVQRVRTSWYVNVTKAMGDWKILAGTPALMIGIPRSSRVTGDAAFQVDYEHAQCVADASKAG